MAEGQTIIENGRVTAFFKTIMSVLAALSTAAIIGVFVSINQLKDSIADLKTEVTIVKLTLDTGKNDTVRMNNAIERINERVSDLERTERRRDSDDNRDE